MLLPQGWCQNKQVTLTISVVTVHPYRVIKTVYVYRDDTRVIFIGSHSHSFVGLDFGSGLVLWKAELGDRIEGSACLSKCAQFIVVGESLTVYVDIKTTGQDIEHVTYKNH